MRAKKYEKKQKTFTFLELSWFFVLSFLHFGFTCHVLLVTLYIWDPSTKMSGVRNRTIRLIMGTYQLKWILKETRNNIFKQKNECNRVMCFTIVVEETGDSTTKVR